MIQWEADIRNEEELTFAVFCIENVAKRLNQSPEQTYLALAEKSDILQSYIVPGYDVLHTQGKEYIVSEIVDIMRERGVA